MGLQVPHSMDSQMSPKGSIWSYPETPWRFTSQSCQTERVQDTWGNPNIRVTKYQI
jgi:hypothetical protein